MPDIYEIQGPDGQIYEIDSDHEPTQDEARQAILRFSKQTAAPERPLSRQRDESRGDWQQRLRAATPDQLDAALKENVTGQAGLMAMPQLFNAALGAVKAGARGVLPYVDKAAKAAQGEGTTVAGDLLKVVSPAVGERLNAAGRLLKRAGGIAPKGAPPVAPPAAPPTFTPNPARLAPMQGAKPATKMWLVMEEAERQGLPRLSTLEAERGTQLIAKGGDPVEVYQQVLASRGNPAADFAKQFGTPSDATVSQRVADRNATGRWSQ